MLIGTNRSTATFGASTGPLGCRQPRRTLRRCGWPHSSPDRDIGPDGRALHLGWLQLQIARRSAVRAENSTVPERTHSVWLSRSSGLAEIAAHPDVEPGRLQFSGKRRQCLTVGAGNAHHRNRGVLCEQLDAATNGTPRSRAGFSMQCDVAIPGSPRCDPPRQTELRR